MVPFNPKIIKKFLFNPIKSFKKSKTNQLTFDTIVNECLNGAVPMVDLTSIHWAGEYRNVAHTNEELNLKNLI